MAGAAGWEYKASLAALSRHYLFNRADHDINDNLDLEARFALIYDNDRNFHLHLEPRVKVDPLDLDRNRYLPNESYLMFFNRVLELSAGLRLMSWGVSRSYNPTDVLNRPDLEGNYYNPDRLGEAMVGVKGTISDAGPFSEIVLEGLVLPWFQETPLPKNDTRFAVEGNVGAVRFNAIETQEYPTFIKGLGAAARVGATIKSVDLTLHYYHGPERNPSYILVIDSRGALRTQPFYYTIDMIGVNIAATLGKFTLHGESALKLTRANAPRFHELPVLANSDVIPNDYLQFVVGSDYTIDGFLRNGTLVLAVEYLGEDDHTLILEEFRPLKNDIFVGLQWQLNDTRLTQVEMGAIKDLSNWEMVFIFEAGTKLYKDLRFSAGGMIINQDDDPGLPLSFFDNNTYLYAKLSYDWGGQFKSKPKAPAPVPAPAPVSPGATLTPTGESPPPSASTMPPP